MVWKPSAKNGAVPEEVETRLKTIERHLPFLDGAENRIQSIENPQPVPKKSLAKRINEYAGFLSLIATLSLAILAGLGYVLNLYVNARIDAAFKAHNFDDLAKSVNTMQGQMKEMSDFVKVLAERELQRQSTLSKPDFEKQIPDVTTTLAAARIVRATVAVDVINEIGSKLESLESPAPIYWQATGELISYRSEVNAKVRISADSNLPECIDTKPTPPEIAHRVTSWDKPFDITPAIFQNCHLTLDSNRDASQLNELMLHGLMPIIAFKNCLISYYGGDVNLTRVWDHTPMTMYLYNRETHRVDAVPTTMTTQAIQFVNCRFDFSIKHSPPSTGQKVTQMLLAQNGGTLGLPTLSSSAQ